jgi:hypothetical protein
MKSVKFWRENPANELSISSGKFRIQKIREIRSSQIIASMGAHGGSVAMDSVGGWVNMLGRLFVLDRRD